MAWQLADLLLLVIPRTRLLITVPFNDFDKDFSTVKLVENDHFRAGQTCCMSFNLVLAHADLQKLT